MSSKSPGKTAKGKTKRQRLIVNTPEEKTQAISAFFKRQIQKCCPDQKVKADRLRCCTQDDDEVEFVKEERCSPYFGRRQGLHSGSIVMPSTSSSDGQGFLGDACLSGWKKPKLNKLSLTKNKGADCLPSQGNKTGNHLSIFKSDKSGKCTSVTFGVTGTEAEMTAADSQNVPRKSKETGMFLTSGMDQTNESDKDTSSCPVNPCNTKPKDNEEMHRHIAEQKMKTKPVKNFPAVFQKDSSVLMSVDASRISKTSKVLDSEKKSSSVQVRKISLKRPMRCRSPSQKSESKKNSEFEMNLDLESGNVTDLKTADRANNGSVGEEMSDSGFRNGVGVNMVEQQVQQSTEKTTICGHTEKHSNADKEDDEDDLLVPKNEGEENKGFHNAYYLENFKTILQSVLTDDENVQLFNEEDLHRISSFNNLSENSQKLYVRLFSRKLAWLPLSRIRYPEIAIDLAVCFDELVNAELLDSGQVLTNLLSILKVMSATDLRNLSKTYHINPSGRQKGQMIQALMQKSQENTIARMFGCQQGSAVHTMIARAKKLLGPLYQLREAPRAVFVRAMMLFSLLSTSGDDESGNGGQSQLFQMVLVNMGKVVYPPYVINRQTRIFREREDLIRFQKALQLEHELLARTTRGDWEGAYSSYLQVREEYDSLKADAATVEWDSSLPEFLRYYTAGSVLVRLLNQGIEILQRQKDYSAAVTLIQELLSQNVYNSDMHGYWWDRLSLNLEVHLKNQEKALRAIQDGMADPSVRSGHRLALFLRAISICNRPKSPFRKRLRDFCHEPLAELPKSTVEGKVVPHTLPGTKYQFVTNVSYAVGNSQDITLCGVEQLVLDHYKMNGFPQGVHAEGAVISTLFCLYFWDILFMDLPDAFHCPYQSTPLDLHTDAFYQRRQAAIDERLLQIQNSTDEDLHDRITRTWEEQQGVMCAGINWERFSSAQQIQELVSCMGGRVLAGILGRYARQPRHTRSGFPDLTLWNPHTKQLKISEVKGPGDRLSHKQMLWLDYLLKLGVDAEVCHVTAVCAKKLRPVSLENVP